MVENEHLPRWMIAIICVYTALCLAGLAFLVLREPEVPAQANVEPQARESQKVEAPQSVQEKSEAAGVVHRWHGPMVGSEQDSNETVMRGVQINKVKPTELSMLFGGDVLLHRKPLDSGYNGDGTYSYEHFFEETTEVSSEADVAVINQETMLSGESYGYQAENYVFNSPQSLAQNEVDAGYDVILKAHNHAFDMGLDWLHDELEFWHNEHPDIPVLGVADPHGDEELPDYVHDVYVCEKNDLKVAILNYTYGTNASGGDASWEYVAHLLDEQKIADDVARARELGADFVIVCPHWGIEYETEPSDEEKRFAQLFADLGVDAVIGGHPHVLQRTEVLEGAEGNTCVVYYSMGNYVASALDTRGVTGGFARLTLRRDEDGACWIDEAEFVPTVVCDSGGKALRTYLARDWTDELAATSAWPGYGRAAVDEYLRSVFGEGYDSESGIFTIDL